MKNYKCYIASNKESKAFDSVNGISAKSAIAAAKRKYSKDKYDLCFWVVCVHENGQEEKL